MHNLLQSSLLFLPLLNTRLGIPFVTDLKIKLKKRLYQSLLKCQNIFIQIIPTIEIYTIIVYTTLQQ